METNILTGKQINEFANSRNDIPDYFGQSVWMPSPEYKKVVTSGSVIAQRYKAIKKTIKEVNGIVDIQPNCIRVTYKNGNFTIQRDLLTDTFLIPLIKE